MISPTWTIPGSDGEPIIGNTHTPDDDPRGTVVIAHGFKGYKDYGMFPRLATRIAGAGWTTHRFNFSHSGMTDDIATFARPDLFERDTWSRQVHDIAAVFAAIERGDLAGDTPIVLFGHSRGGVASILAAGRHAELSGLAAVITAAAPSACGRMDERTRTALLEQGFLVSPSSRTGQDLRIGRVFLQEQIDEPEAHDLLTLATRINVPVLVVHGEDDPTVPVADAVELAAAIPVATLVTVPGGNHVFNMPNPCPEDLADSTPFAAMMEAIEGFLERVV